jgi:signal transduction histidine kinase
MQADRNDNGDGVGLRNTRSRLQHLYGSGHRFELKTPSGGGVAVTIVIPFLSEAEMPDPSSESSAPGSPMESVA